jgi:hypothetical protein
MEKRQRGGQPGNHNAVKHGFYSRELNKQEKVDFNIAAGMDGIEEEIALLRYKIKKAVTSGEISDLIPLSRITYALEKLIRTNQKLFAPANSNEAGLRKLFREVLAMGGDPRINALLAHRKFPDEFPPVTLTNPDEKTKPNQNEAK